jgi:YHS domain-containing protein
MLSASTMTAPRQKKKGWRLRAAFLVLPAVMAALVGFGFSAWAGTTERVVVNRYTGLAIEGFDPVGYFTEARPVPGQSGFEASEAGAVWRFCNEGNRAAFVAHPDIYGPQFGGYDPVDIARGVTFAGNPQLWAISQQRLYLFGRQESRDAFITAPDTYLSEANRRWLILQETLAQ